MHSCWKERKRRNRRKAREIIILLSEYYDEKIGKLMMRKRGSGFILVYVCYTYSRVIYVSYT